MINFCSIVSKLQSVQRKGNKPSIHISKSKEEQTILFSFDSGISDGLQQLYFEAVFDDDTKGNSESDAGADDDTTEDKEFEIIESVGDFPVVGTLEFKLLLVLGISDFVSKSLL
ncbi:unnamed protein product [[Candida] boidinii]|nr:unnamed protein product [[Candida] boidinii]